MAGALVWPASKGLPLPWRSPLRSSACLLPRPGPATTRSCLAGCTVLSPPSISHMTARELLLECRSEESRGAVVKAGSRRVAHSVPHWVLPLPPCLSPPLPHSGLVALTIPSAWKPALPPALPSPGISPCCPTGGPGTHVSLPSHSPCAWLSSTWQFLREGGKPGLAWPGTCVW